MENKPKTSQRLLNPSLRSLTASSLFVFFWSCPNQAGFGAPQPLPTLPGCCAAPEAARKAQGRAPTRGFALPTSMLSTSREKKKKNGDGFEHPSPTREGLTSSHPPLVPEVPPARPKGCSPGGHRVPSVAQARFGDNTRPGWESFGHWGRSSGGGVTHGPVALPGLLTCRRCQDWGRALLQPQQQSQDPSGVRGCWVSQ